MAVAKSFRDLDVYRLALRDARRVFEVTRDFPQEEYSLTDQFRRSSRAVGALLAKAWGRRRYPASFVHKLTEALGEAMETQAWLDHALAGGYHDSDTHEDFDDAWQHVGAMLTRMIQNADSFCTHVAT